MNLLQYSKHFETALAYYENAFKVVQRLCGENCEEIAGMHRNIFDALIGLQRYDEAKQRAEQAMRISLMIQSFTEIE